MTANYFGSISFRYPQKIKFRYTEIWFWILSLFYLYPDEIPHFLKIGIAVNVLVVSPHFCSLNSAVTQASIRHNVVFM
jgi:hypothetical protein